MINKSIRQIIDIFLENPILRKLNIEFQHTIPFTEKEYSELTKDFNLVGGEGKYWITSDEFEKIENDKWIVRMTIHYIQEYGILEVYQIDLERGKRDGS